MRRQKLTQGYKLASIIGKQSSNTSLKLIFDQGFECHECGFDIRFYLQWEHPCVSRKVVDQDNVVFEVVNGEYW